MASDQPAVRTVLSELTESTHPMWQERRYREARARQIQRDLLGQAREEDPGFRGVRYVGSSNAPEMAFR